jgi:type III pantothenate kinase
MNLCIDIGNSRVKIAIYDGNKEVYFLRNENLDLALLREMKNNYNINNCILSTTRILDERDLFFLKNNFNLLILDEATKVPIKNLYETPKTLGKDRLAAAIAAAALYPNENCIIIDAGTCLTYNFIDKLNQYHGGNIAPGIAMRLKSMHTFTDKLPLVEPSYNESLFGKNTEMALQNGAVKGAIYELSTFITEVNKQYGESKLILTGGDAILFVKHLKNEIFAHPNLVLLGLNEILKFNAD